MKNINIVLCGLGGQGIVSVTKLFGEMCLSIDKEVKVNNIIGLGQRGGSVSCHIRIGEDPILSPTIEYGQADMLISLENTELLRNFHYLKPGGTCIYHDYKLTSPTVNVNLEEEMDYDIQYLAKQRQSQLIRLEDYYDQHVQMKRMINYIILPFLCRKIKFTQKEELFKNKKIKHSENKLSAMSLGENIMKDACYE